MNALSELNRSTGEREGRRKGGKGKEGVSMPNPQNDKNRRHRRREKRGISNLNVDQMTRQERGSSHTGPRLDALYKIGRDRRIPRPANKTQVYQKYKGEKGGFKPLLTTSDDAARICITQQA